MAGHPHNDLIVATPVTWREMCFSLPATRALANHVGEIGILCPERQRRFWQLAGFENLHAYPDDFKPRAIVPLLHGFSRVLLWEAGPAADACAKAEIPERIGVPAAGLAKRLTMPLERVLGPGPPEHRVRRFLDTAGLLGADPMQPKYFEPVPCDAPETHSATLVLPDSDFGRHYEWPVERWRELLESRPADSLKLATGALACRLAGDLGISQVQVDPAVPGSFLGYRLCLAADGSLPHLAAAFGTTCAVFFGPGDPNLTRPLGKQHLVIRRKVECSPCFLDRCPIDLRCQHDLAVERARRLLADFKSA